MRIAIVVVPLVAALHSRADACPEDRDGPDCTLAWQKMRFDHLTHIVDLSYLTNVTAIAATGGASRVNTSVGVDAGYTAQFGGQDRPEYEISASIGATARRTEGADGVRGNAIETRAAAKLGPAALFLADTMPHSNTVWFPLSFEITHDGDLAELPRLSARPDVLRARYGRERITLSTQMMRMETSGDSVAKDRVAGPGERKPVAMAFDVVPLDASFEATLQNGARYETTVGGSALRVIGRVAEGLRVDVLGVEYQDIRLPSGTRTDITTFWGFRADYVNPKTGTHYFAGWGGIVEIPDQELWHQLTVSTDANGKETDGLQVGGLGFWVDRPWGTIGGQYRREPFVTMTGEAAIEDRGFVEATMPGALSYTVRAFAARTQHIVDAALKSDYTMGVEVDAAKRLGGFDFGLHAEAGQTFYAAVDNTTPDEVGFAAHAALSITRAGSTRWSH